MTKPILSVIFSLMVTHQAIASTQCFIAKEDDKIILQEGTCSKRYSPCSTFKIPLALMGYNEKILVDEALPQWPYKQAYEAGRKACEQSLNPSTWMQNSCIWYSQEITQKLGMTKFKSYISQFSYGNQDLAGDKGKNNGLTRSWLSSSLTISPEEQIAFLEKLINLKLPVSLDAQEQTKKIILVEELRHSWMLYGKTGSGLLKLQDGSTSDGRQVGWFVGWLQKEDRKIIFAHYIEDETKEETPGGMRAKEIAKDKLLTLTH